LSSEGICQYFYDFGGPMLRERQWWLKNSLSNSLVEHCQVRAFNDLFEKHSEYDEDLGPYFAITPRHIPFLH
jgi:hypothetical protein